MDRDGVFGVNIDRSWGNCMEKDPNDLLDYGPCIWIRARYIRHPIGSIPEVIAVGNRTDGIAEFMARWERMS